MAVEKFIPDLSVLMPAEEDLFRPYGSSIYTLQDGLDDGYKHVAIRFTIHGRQYYGAFKISHWPKEALDKPWNECGITPRSTDRDEYVLGFIPPDGPTF